MEVNVSVRERASDNSKVNNKSTMCFRETTRFRSWHQVQCVVVLFCFKLRQIGPPGLGNTCVKSTGNFEFFTRCWKGWMSRPVPGNCEYTIQWLSITGYEDGFVFSWISTHITSDWLRQCPRGDSGRMWYEFQTTHPLLRYKVEVVVSVCRGTGLHSLRVCFKSSTSQRTGPGTCQWTGPGRERYW